MKIIRFFEVFWRRIITRNGQKKATWAMRFFLYRYDDIKIEVDEQYQIRCAGSGDEFVDVRAAKSVGVLSASSMSGRRSRENPVVPINHWWGFIDERGARKRAYYTSPLLLGYCSRLARFK